MRCVARGHGAGQDSVAFAELWWGARLSGLEADPGKLNTSDLEEPLETAWRGKAPKRLAAEYVRRPSSSSDE